MEGKLTSLRIKLIKEQAIREYKARHEKKGNHSYLDFVRILRKLAPINIILGIIASILLIYLKGWSMFFQLVLTGIIWITIISTALAALGKKKL